MVDSGLLERMVGAFGLDSVLDALAVICQEKAEHAMVNWQDMALAREWQRAAKQVDRCMTAVHGVGR